MSDIKIAFFDIDGTLVPFGRKGPSKKTIEALNRLKDKGILLCVATGRTPTAIPRWEGLDFDIYLSANGSLSYNHKEVIFKNLISKDSALKVIDNAKKYKKTLVLVTDNNKYISGFNFSLIMFNLFNHSKFKIKRDLSDVLDEDIIQIILGSNKEVGEKIIKDIEGIKAAAWWSQSVDIVPSGSGKGVAVGKILEYYGFDKSEAIAFGDAENDIDMLKEVGVSVAMGNASKEVKDIAKEVTESSSDDGIYHYLLKRGLI